MNPYENDTTAQYAEAERIVETLNRVGFVPHAIIDAPGGGTLPLCAPDRVSLTLCAPDAPIECLDDAAWWVSWDGRQWYIGDQLA